jgi:hypothetical protein
LAATDWTYGSDSTGEAPLATGHGLETGDTIDLYFAGGYRRGMSATVDGDDVALSGGTGSNCPPNGTAVILAQQAAVTLVVEGNNIKGIFGVASVRSLFCLVDSLGTVYPYELVPASDAVETPKCLKWSTSNAGANPWADKTIVSATASSANTTAPVSPAKNQPIIVGLQFDSTVGSGS